MVRHFTLEYWLEDGWYVGKLKEVPIVFGQGKTVAELEEQIRDSYRRMIKESTVIPPGGLQTKELEIEV